MTQNFKISLFKDKFDTKPKMADRTWSELCSKFQKPQIRADKDGALFCPATFDPAHRCNENVRELSLLVLDIDHNAELLTLKTHLTQLGTASAIYSTHSHLRKTESNPKAEPRFRVCIPLMAPIPADQYPALWQSMKQKTGLPLDENAKDVSRMFYTPAIANQEAAYEVHIIEGSFLDWRTLPLELLPVKPVRKDNGSGPTGSFEFHEDRHAELCRRITVQARDTGRGTFEMKCPAHNGKGKTSLFFSPSDGSVSCRNDCTYFEILKAFGLPNERLTNSKHAMTAARVEDRLEFANSEPDPLPEPLARVPQIDPEIIPEPLRVWLPDISERMQCPLEYPTAAAMTALGAVIGNKVGIKPKGLDGWIELPNLWGGVVGDPGVMKSPAVNEALRFVKEIENDELLGFETKRLDIEFEKEARDSEKKEIRRQLEGLFKPLKKNNDDGAIVDRLADRERLKERFKELEAKPDAKAPRLWTSDATVEKLGELLNENPQGLFNIRDELSGLFEMLDKPGREGDRQFYLEGWTGTGEYCFDRIGRGTIRIKNMTLSIFGTIQPSIIHPYLREASSKNKDDGLIQRFQMLVYPDIPPGYQYIDRTPMGLEDARHIFKRLRNLDPNAIGIKKLTDEAGGYAFLNFDNTAQDFFQEWLTGLEKSLRNDSFVSVILKSHFAKYRGLMPTLALIFQLVEYASGKGSIESVSLKNAELAAVWCSFLQKHAERLYSMAINSEMTVSRSILDHIRTGRLDAVFNTRSIYRKGWSGLTKPKEVQDGIDVLVEYGWLLERRIETAGRPKREYIAHGDLI